jgi:hypothetical protein
LPSALRGDSHKWGIAGDGPISQAVLTNLTSGEESSLGPEAGVPPAQRMPGQLNAPHF